jgi:hypothetical protein
VNPEHEWAAVVTTAVLGTERRPVPPPPDELVPWSTADDQAVALLDRAAALVAARRAGIRPLAPTPVLTPPDPDAHSPCPAAAATLLRSWLRGGRAELVTEWLERLVAGGHRLPAEHAPRLLRRAQGDPRAHRLAWAAAGPLAGWLAAALPDPALEPPPTTPSTPSPPTPATADPAAVLAAFAQGRAGAARSELRAMVMALPVEALRPLADALEALAGQPLTAGLRDELATLARERWRMAEAFAEAVR